MSNTTQSKAKLEEACAAAELAQQAALKAKRERLHQAFGLDENGLCQNERAATVSEHHCDVLIGKLDGETWLAFSEGVTRRAVWSAVEANLGETFFERLKVMVDSTHEGAADEYRHWLFVKTDLFNNIHNFRNILEAGARRNDGDLDRAIIEIQRWVTLDVPSLSEDPEAEIDLISLLIALQRQIGAGLPLYANKVDSLAIPTAVTLGSSMGHKYLEITFGKLAVPYNDGIAKAEITMYVWDQGSMAMKTLPFRLTNDVEIAEIKKRNRAIIDNQPKNGVSHVKYEGVALEPGMFGSIRRYHVNGRVVFDTHGAYLQNPNNASALFGLIGLEVERNDDDEAIPAMVTENDIMQLVTAGLMYDLSSSTWRLGRYNMTSPIEYRADAFEHLVLDSDRKRLVRALTQFRAKGVEVDIVDGKGGGSIFMLDGAPGTGKTLTAEATAEVQQRVLYKVGLGDLGITPGDLERSLQRILAMAARWDAILLIDEADVFMERRDSNNIQRNALVAVFLRLLEYYNGIMFLTTNRGANFDPAFRSRVTLAIHYKSPTEEGRRTIWANLLRNMKLELSQSDIEMLAAHDVNGREIKNAVNSARALAAHDGTEVTAQHIEDILKCQALFDQEVSTIDVQPSL